MNSAPKAETISIPNEMSGVQSFAGKPNNFEDRIPFDTSEQIQPKVVELRNQYGNNPDLRNEVTSTINELNSERTKYGLPQDTTLENAFVAIAKKRIRREQLGIVENEVENVLQSEYIVEMISKRAEAILDPTQRQRYIQEVIKQLAETWGHLFPENISQVISGGNDVSSKPPFVAVMNKLQQYDRLGNEIDGGITDWQKRYIFFKGTEINEFDSYLPDETVIDELTINSPEPLPIALAASLLEQSRKGKLSAAFAEAVNNERIVRGRIFTESVRNEQVEKLFERMVTLIRAGSVNVEEIETMIEKYPDSLTVEVFKKKFEEFKQYNPTSLCLDDILEEKEQFFQKRKLQGVRNAVTAFAELIENVNQQNVKKMHDTLKVLLLREAVSLSILENLFSGEKSNIRNTILSILDSKTKKLIGSQPGRGFAIRINYQSKLHTRETDDENSLSTDDEFKDLNGYVDPQVIEMLCTHSLDLRQHFPDLYDEPFAESKARETITRQL